MAKCSVCHYGVLIAGLPGFDPRDLRFYMACNLNFLNPSDFSSKSAGFAPTANEDQGLSEQSLIVPFQKLEASEDDAEPRPLVSTRHVAAPATSPTECEVGSESRSDIIETWVREDIPMAEPVICCPLCPICGEYKTCATCSFRKYSCQCTGSWHLACEACGGCERSTCGDHDFCICNSEWIKSPLLEPGHSFTFPACPTQLSGSHGEWTCEDDHRDRLHERQNDALYARAQLEKGLTKKILLTFHRYLCRHPRGGIRQSMIEFLDRADTSSGFMKSVSAFLADLRMHCSGGEFRAGRASTTYSYMRKAARIMLERRLIKNPCRCYDDCLRAISHAPPEMAKYQRAVARGIKNSHRGRNYRRQLSGSHGEWTESDDVRGRGDRARPSPKHAPRMRNNRNNGALNVALQQLADNAATAGPPIQVHVAGAQGPIPVAQPNVEVPPQNQPVQPPVVQAPPPNPILVAARAAGHQATEVPDHLENVELTRIGMSQFGQLTVWEFCSTDPSGEYVIPQTEVDKIIAGDLNNSRRMNYASAPNPAQRVAPFVDDGVLDELPRINIIEDLNMLPVMVHLMKMFFSFYFPNLYFILFTLSILLELVVFEFTPLPGFLGLTARPHVHFTSLIACLISYQTGFGTGIAEIFLAVQSFISTSTHRLIFTLLFGLINMFSMGWLNQCYLLRGTSSLVCHDPTPSLSLLLTISIQFITLYSILTDSPGPLHFIRTRRATQRRIKLRNDLLISVQDPRTVACFESGFWEHRITSRYVGQQLNQSAADAFTDNRGCHAKAKPHTAECSHELIWHSRLRHGTVATRSRIELKKKTILEDLGCFNRLLLRLHLLSFQTDLEILGNDLNGMITRVISSSPIPYDAHQVNANVHMSHCDSLRDMLHSTIRTSVPAVNRHESSLPIAGRIVRGSPLHRMVIFAAFQHEAKKAPWHAQHLNGGGNSIVPLKLPAIDPGTSA
jgi:hypothetical protein